MIKSVTEDLETQLNTAIARLMELTNALSKAKPNCWGSDLWTEAVRGLLLLLAPVTPQDDRRFEPPGVSLQHSSAGLARVG